MILAVSCRRDTFDSLEYIAEPAGVGESTGFGNLLYQDIGVCEETLGAFDSESRHLFGYSAASVCLKESFKRALRNRNVGDNIPHLDWAVALIGNKT